MKCMDQAKIVKSHAFVFTLISTEGLQSGTIQMPTGEHVENP